MQDVLVNGSSVVDEDGNANIDIPIITKTVTGNPIVVDDADGAVQALHVELLPVQEGSGTPSPQNIRPITGHDSVTVTDTDGDSQSQSKTVTMPHTVYGAGVGVTSGEGKEKWGIVDAGSLSWEDYQSTAFVASIPGRAYGNFNVLSSIYPTTTATTMF